MAYEPSAAASIQAAEISSPRETASTVQPAAPASATSDQMTIDRGVRVVRRELGGAVGSGMVHVPSLITCNAQEI
ncbi:hypothetical protein GCM10010274_47970 [Streptomyces lavendofoliae]|uniref:Uncharacterized protein n=1 Tax=Streptomyces lavendofoliae TaxID=67314 RepID=A0A918I1X3_9ACTN|nr:hypothetical protein GCM10010274_47970 [Streptomyces lavendofoliae]